MCGTNCSRDTGWYWKPENADRVDSSSTYNYRKEKESRNNQINPTLRASLSGETNNRRHGLTGIQPGRVKFYISIWLLLPDQVQATRNTAWWIEENFVWCASCDPWEFSRNQWPEDCFCSKLNIHHSRFCLPRRLNVIQWAVWFGSFTGHVAIHTIANGITLVVSALDDKTQSLANLSTNVICLKISLVLRFPTSPNLMTFEHKFLHGMV